MYVNQIFDDNIQLSKEIVYDTGNCVNLKIIHVNIRSMRKNWELLQWHINETQVKWDVIAVTEVNIKKEEVSNYKWNGYTNYDVTREHTARGGGIMIYIDEKYSINEKNIKRLDIGKSDGVEIQITKNNQDFKLIAIYRKPDTNKEKFIQELKKIIKTDNKENKNTILIGDINIDILKQEDESKDKHDQNVIDKYENQMAGLGFKKLIDSPTREEVIKLKDHRVQRSCIDHIFIKKGKDWKAKGATINKKIADHYLTLCWVWNTDKIEKYKIDEENKTRITYKQKNIVNDLKNQNWDELNTIDCPNKLYEEINRTIEYIYKKNIKSEIITTKKDKNIQKRKDWITEETIKLINKKNKLWKQIQNKNDNISQEIVIQYRELKNLITKKIKDCKQNYYTLKLGSAQKSNKTLWEIVNEINGKNLENRNIDKTIIKNFKDIEIATLRNDFNNSFIKQVPDLRKKFERRLQNYKSGKHFNDTYNKNKNKNKKKENTKTMFIDYANEAEIVQIITEMKETNATGKDGFKTDHLKQSKENTSKIICKLINKMIDKEVWPEMLKIQVLRPIYKKGDKTDKNNYRPISLLSVIDKIIEKFFSNKIRQFLEKFRLLSKLQYGYTPKKGTTDLLIQINEIITKALNEKKYVGAVLIDLQKAFDTFDQEILLKKCEKIGLRGKIYNLIKSYLANRRSLVKIADDYSDENEIKYGVPQGSVLGPLLFLIYVNDISDCVNKTLIYLFADDTIMISINYNYSEMISNLQKDFDMLNGWLMENELYISEDKTVQIDITVPKMKNIQKNNIVNHSENCQLMKYGRNSKSCNETCKKIQNTQSAKYLGLQIDSHWNFKQHIINLINKLRQMMPKLYNVRSVINLKNKMILYEAWISSLLRYGIEIYGFASDYLLNRLQRVQNKVVKVLFGNNENKTEDIYSKNNILKVKQLRDYTIILKYYHTNMYKNYDKKKSKILRQTTQKYEIPQWSNTYGLRNKNYYIPSIFNKLPKQLLNIKSTKERKSRIKQILIENK